ncbi:MAG: hypothetical protein RSD26_10485 [Cellulosilyticaceae bacterium]
MGCFLIPCGVRGEGEWVGVMKLIVKVIKPIIIRMNLAVVNKMIEDNIGAIGEVE